MRQLISIREANQRLSQYIKKLSAGDEVIITSRGKPVARLLPVNESVNLTTEQKLALERLKVRMNKGYSLEGGNRSEILCMSGDRTTLDSNILIYAIDRDAGRKKQKASALIEELAGTDCVLTFNKH